MVSFASFPLPSIQRKAVRQNSFLQKYFVISLVISK